jgi:hypothetical protein
LDLNIFESEQILEFKFLPVLNRFSNLTKLKVEQIYNLNKIYRKNRQKEKRLGLIGPAHPGTPAGDGAETITRSGD